MKRLLLVSITGMKCKSLSSSYIGKHYWDIRTYSNYYFTIVRSSSSFRASSISTGENATKTPEKFENLLPVAGPQSCILLTKLPARTSVFLILLASAGSANDTCSKRYKFFSPVLSNRPFIQEQNVNRDV